MPTVLIPAPLRPHVGGNASVDASGATVAEVLTALTTEHPALKQHLFNDEGALRSFVNIYLNDEDIRYLSKQDTPVAPADTLTIVPSIAGGLL